MDSVVDLDFLTPAPLVSYYLSQGIWETPPESQDTNCLEITITEVFTISSVVPRFPWAVEKNTQTLPCLMESMIQSDGVSFLNNRSSDLSLLSMDDCHAEFMQTMIENQMHLLDEASRALSPFILGMLHKITLLRWMGNAFRRVKSNYCLQKISEIYRSPCPDPQENTALFTKLVHSMTCLLEKGLIDTSSKILILVRINEYLMHCGPASLSPFDNKFFETLRTILQHFLSIDSYTPKTQLLPIISFLALSRARNSLYDYLLAMHTLSQFTTLSSSPAFKDPVFSCRSAPPQASPMRSTINLTINSPIQTDNQIIHPEIPCLNQTDSLSIVSSVQLSSASRHVSPKSHDSSSEHISLAVRHLSWRPPLFLSVSPPDQCPQDEPQSDLDELLRYFDELKPDPLIFHSSRNAYEIWTWGQNSYGELAHGDTFTRNKPSRVESFIHCTFIQAAAGNEHTLLLNSAGEVFSVGYNDNGQCGTGTNDHRVKSLTQIPSLKGVPIQSIHAENGCEHSLFVTREGQLYSCGYNNRGQLGHCNTTSLTVPRLIEKLSKFKVRAVACSYYHTIVSTIEGMLFAFGRNDSGQLGLGDVIDRYLLPQRGSNLFPIFASNSSARLEPEVVSLPSPPVAFACGQYFTIVSLANKEIYGMGKNEHGELGVIGYRPYEMSPQRIKFPDKNLSISELACGYFHTLCLSVDGKLFGFGRNDFGQLGLGESITRSHHPVRIEIFDGIMVTQISCGCYHSMVLDEFSVLYTFGKNNQGQLGTEDQIEHTRPISLRLFQGRHVVMMAAGFYHNIILLGEQRQKTLMLDPPSMSTEYCWFSDNDLPVPLRSFLKLLMSLDRLILQEIEFSSIPPSLSIATSQTDFPPILHSLTINTFPSFFKELMGFLTSVANIPCSIEHKSYVYLVLLHLLQANLSTVIVSGQGNAYALSVSKGEENQFKPIFREMPKILLDLILSSDLHQFRPPVNTAAMRCFLCGMPLFFLRFEELVSFILMLLSHLSDNLNSYSFVLSYIFRCFTHTEGLLYYMDLYEPHATSINQFLFFLTGVMRALFDSTMSCIRDGLPLNQLVTDVCTHMFTLQRNLFHDVYPNRSRTIVQYCLDVIGQSTTLLSFLIDSSSPRTGSCLFSSADMCHSPIGQLLTTVFLELQLHSGCPNICQSLLHPFTDYLLKLDHFIDVNPPMWDSPSQEGGPTSSSTERPFEACNWLIRQVKVLSLLVGQFTTHFIFSPSPPPSSTPSPPPLSSNSVPSTSPPSSSLSNPSSAVPSILPLSSTASSLKHWLESPLFRYSVMTREPLDLGHVTITKSTSLNPIFRRLSKKYSESQMPTQSPRSPSDNHLSTFQNHWCQFQSRVEARLESLRSWGDQFSTEYMIARRQTQSSPILRDLEQNLFLGLVYHSPDVLTLIRHNHRPSDASQTPGGPSVLVTSPLWRVLFRFCMFLRCTLFGLKRKQDADEDPDRFSEVCHNLLQQSVFILQINRATLPHYKPLHGSRAASLHWLRLSSILNVSIRLRFLYRKRQEYLQLLSSPSNCPTSQYPLIYVHVYQFLLGPICSAYCSQAQVQTEIEHRREVARRRIFGLEHMKSILSKLIMNSSKGDFLSPYYFLTLLPNSHYVDPFEGTEGVDVRTRHNLKLTVNSFFQMLMIYISNAFNESAQSQFNDFFLSRVFTMFVFSSAKKSTLSRIHSRLYTLLGNTLPSVDSREATDFMASSDAIGFYDPPASFLSPYIRCFLYRVFRYIALSLSQATEFLIRNSSQTLLTPMYTVLSRSLSFDSSDDLDPIRRDILNSAIDLFSGMRYFNNVDEGYSRDDILPSPSFSISFWIYLIDCPSSENQLLLLRVSNQNFCPKVVIRPYDYRIEVSFSASNESFLSKDRVPIQIWTHLSFIFEKGNMKLYVNGKLDSQKQIISPMDNSKEHLFIGTVSQSKLPLLSSTQHGFEGCIQRCSYSYRALSPIHIVKMFTKGVSCDRKQPFLISSFVNACLLLRNPFYLQSFLSPSWLILAFRGLARGPFAIQEASMYFLNHLLPFFNPRSVPLEVMSVFYIRTSASFKSIIDLLFDIVLFFYDQDALIGVFNPGVLCSPIQFGFHYTPSSCINTQMILLIQKLFRTPFWLSELKKYLDRYTNVFLSHFYHISGELAQSQIPNKPAPLSRVQAQSEKPASNSLHFSFFRSDLPPLVSSPVASSKSQPHSFFGSSSSDDVSLSSLFSLFLPFSHVTDTFYCGAKVTIAHTAVRASVVDYDSMNMQIILYLHPPAPMSVPARIAITYTPFHSDHDPFDPSTQTSIQLPLESRSAVSFAPEELLLIPPPVPEMPVPEPYFRLIHMLINSRPVLDIFQTVHSKPIVSPTLLFYSLSLMQGMASLFSLRDHPEFLSAVLDSTLFGDLMLLSDYPLPSDEYFSFLEYIERNLQLKRRFYQLTYQKHQPKTDDFTSLSESTLRDLIDRCHAFSMRSTNTLPDHTQSRSFASIPMPSSFFPERSSDFSVHYQGSSSKENSYSYYGYSVFAMDTLPHSDKRKLSSEHFSALLTNFSFDTLIHEYVRNSICLSVLYSRSTLLSVFRRIQNSESPVEVPSFSFSDLFCFGSYLGCRGPILGYYPYSISDHLHLQTPLYSARHLQMQKARTPAMEVFEDFLIYLSKQSVKDIRNPGSSGIVPSLYQYFLDMLLKYSNSSDCTSQRRSHNLFLTDEECASPQLEQIYWFFEILFPLDPTQFLNETFLNTLMAVLWLSSSCNHAYLYLMLATVLREFYSQPRFPQNLNSIISSFPWQKVYHFFLQDTILRHHPIPPSSLSAPSDSAPQKCGPRAQQYNLYLMCMLDCLIIMAKHLSQCYCSDDPIPSPSATTFENDSLTFVFAEPPTIGFVVSVETKHNYYELYYPLNRCVSSITPPLPHGEPFSIRYRMMDTLQFSKWSDPPLTLPPMTGIPFSFDSSFSAAGIQLLLGDGGLTVARCCTMRTWSTVLCNQSIGCGIARWSLKIDDISNGSIAIGVCTRSNDLTNYIGFDECGWGFMSDGEFFHNGQGVSYGDKFTTGDLITVEFNSDQGVIIFLKNGTPLGVACEAIGSDVYPAVSLYYSGARVSLQGIIFEDQASCVAPLEHLQFPILTDFMTVQSLLESYLHGDLFSCKDIVTMHGIYCSWMRNHLVFFNDKHIDCSPSTLKPYKFQYGQRVLTPLGRGHVLGVCKKKLWFFINKLNSVKFFSEASLIYVIPLPDDWPHEDSPPLDLNQFQLSNSPDLWTHELDSTLSRCLPSLLHDHVFDPSSLQAIVPSFEQSFSVSQHGMSVLDVLRARSLFLLHLNGLVRPFLYRIDLSFEYQYFNRPFHNHTGMYLPSLLSQCRHLFFDKVPAFMERVDDSGRKAIEEDNDYPNDFPVVTVNRNLSKQAQRHEDPLIRLMNSVFHQLFDQLHFLEIDKLRYSYVHNINDGQLRAFRIKFLGEGCDDYGGPYREIFGDVGEELFTLNESGTECLLSLFMPSPNHQNRIGSSQDSFIINPSVTRDHMGFHTYQELFHFIGQLMGIAIRSHLTVSFPFPPYYWKFLVGQSLSPHDLQSLDSYQYDSLNHLKRTSREYKSGLCTRENYESVIENFSWSYHDSTTFEVSLKSDGPKRALLIEDDIQEYVRIVSEERLLESRSSLLAIKDGLQSVIPSSLISFLTWEDLRDVLCGSPVVRVEELRSITVYDDSIASDTELIGRFWKAITEMTDRDRIRFLRFVSGRTQIVRGMNQRFKLLKKQLSDATQDPNSLLPTSHTCFFSLLLPPYQSDEILKSKLLYAIYNCDEMDGDHRINDSELGGVGTEMQFSSNIHNSLQHSLAAPG